MIVSHATSHKLIGAFHEETAYGFIGKDDKKGYVRLAVRKPLSHFKTEKHIEAVRDDAWGTRMTYIPASEIARVNIRIK